MVTRLLERNLNFSEADFCGAEVGHIELRVSGSYVVLLNPFSEIIREQLMFTRNVALDG